MVSGPLSHRKNGAENMLSIHCLNANDLPPEWADDMSVRLCRPDSEMQGWLRHMAEGSPDHPDELMFAVATRENETGDQEIIGWAGINVWNSLPSLQAFVAPEFRGLALGTTLSAALLFEAKPPGAIAVFSPACYRIAKRLNLEDVRLYKSVDDGWIRVSTEALDEPRDGAAGVHDPAG